MSAIATREKTETCGIAEFTLARARLWKYCTDEDEKERDVIIPLHDVRPTVPAQSQKQNLSRRPRRPAIASGL